VKDMRKNWNNGFTLAELLVVVAIIVVLVAVSIPIFTGKVEKARAAACLSNKTALYHEIAADLISGDITYDQIDDALLATYVAKQEAKCPSDGTYSISKDTENETFKVVCSYHDNGKKVVLKGLDNDTDRLAAFKNSSNEFLTAFKEVADWKTPTNMDSDSVGSTRVAKMADYLATYNITSNGTKYWSLRNVNGKWYYFYTTKDISSYSTQEGQNKIVLARYDIENKTISLVSTKVVSTSTGSDSKVYYNTIPVSKSIGSTIEVVKNKITDAEAVSAMNNQN